ncbi:MAG: L,D-transpeptidase [Actinomycetota bacterium]|nr:L,D-transpeptidase [Actinomycetota bacterium]
MNHMTINRTLSRSVLAGLALAAVALTACGGERPTLTGPTTSAGVSTDASADASPTDASTDPATIVAPTAPTAPPVATDAPLATAAPPSTAAAAVDTVPIEPAHLRAVSLVAELVVVDQPDGAPILTLPAATVFGTPTVLGVVGTTGEWVQVLTPVRPNDQVGWVRTSDVRLEPVTFELHVDIVAKTLRLLEHGQPVGEWTVAVGTAENPTPTGRYFVTDKLATGDPDGVYGDWAFGLSAHSDKLTDFIGGIGQIGLHGTNNPSSIGQAASHGCIRLPNEVMATLIDLLPIGTPITIA